MAQELLTTFENELGEVADLEEARHHQQGHQSVEADRHHEAETLALLLGAAAEIVDPRDEAQVETLFHPVFRDAGWSGQDVGGHGRAES